MLSHRLSPRAGVPIPAIARRAGCNPQDRLQNPFDFHQNGHQQAQPDETNQIARQQAFGSLPFRDVGRGNFHPQEQPQRVDQQMSFAALDPFGRVIAHLPAMRIGVHALAVQDRGGGAAAFVVRLANMSAQASVDGLPGVLQSPFPKTMEDGFERRKILGQQAPFDAAFDDVKNGVEEAAATGGGRPSGLRWEGLAGEKPIGR